VLRLLICDDHKLLVDALSMALSDNGRTVVATALDPEEAVEAARVHQPDACLLDVHFPNGNGLNVIGRIHAVSPNTKVVILSGSISPGLVADAIVQGAQGFVGKEKPIGVIIETLEKAVQGHLAVDPLMLQDVLLPRAQHGDPLWALKFLTSREWAALRCIVDGLTTEQMANSLVCNGVRLARTSRTCLASSACTAPAGGRPHDCPRLGGHLARPPALTLPDLPDLPDPPDRPDLPDPARHLTPRQAVHLNPRRAVPAGEPGWRLRRHRPGRARAAGPRCSR
jgi:two-component system nitrate/nitrite response regulator NarL